MERKEIEAKSISIVEEVINNLREQFTAKRKIFAGLFDRELKAIQDENNEEMKMQYKELWDLLSTVEKITEDVLFKLKRPGPAPIAQVYGLFAMIMFYLWAFVATDRNKLELIAISAKNVFLLDNEKARLMLDTARHVEIYGVAAGMVNKGGGGQGNNSNSTVH